MCYYNQFYGTATVTAIIKYTDIFIWVEETFRNCDEIHINNLQLRYKTRTILNMFQINASR